MKRIYPNQKKNPKSLKRYTAEYHGSRFICITCRWSDLSRFMLFSHDFQEVKVKLSCKFAKFSLILCIFCMVMTMSHTQEMQTYLHFMIFYLMTYVANKLHLCRINQHLDENISLYARLMIHVAAIEYLFHIL